MSVNRFLTIACLAGITTLSAGGWGAVAGADRSGEALAADGRTPKEQAAIAVLRGDAPEADKALACKELAVFGSADAVPDLAKLLGNERLASWARIPLEAIPDPACDTALREAAGRLSGPLLVGVLNSLGVRRDAAAVDLLATRLADADPAVALAAAAALGNVGTPAAVAPLRRQLAALSAPLRDAAAEGCVRCAERLLATNDAAAAVTLYDAVRQAAVSRQRIVEATRGAILSRGDQGVPLLVEQLRSPDRHLHAIALSTVREMPSPAVTQALTAELSRAPPDRAALLVAAVADRGGPTAIATLREASALGPTPVRLAALRALGRIGDASCVEPLLATATDADADLAAAAKTALAEMPGDGGTAIADLIRGRLARATGATLPLLIEIVGRRRIGAVSEVAAALANPDPAVRARALTCLGEIVDLEQLPLLIDQLIKAEDPADAAAAQKPLLAASVRMPDREACAERLAAAMAAARPEARLALVEVLGQVGGAKALAALDAAARSDELPLQDASTRLLGNWMTPDAGPALLELAKTLPAGKFQSRAFRGYLRILRQFTPTDADRSRMGELAFAAARSDDDRKAVLDAVRRTPTLEMLRLVAEAAATPTLRDEARVAAATIMTKMGAATPEAWALAGRLDLPQVQLEILRATYGAGDVQRDVTTPLRKVAGNVPLIPLPAAGYNASFGGDPAPGQSKRLSIQYTLDGRPGEATFAEDSLIVLPIPGAAKAVRFRKQTLTERFVAEGCDLADFDHDGHVDVTAGHSIWFGPDFARRSDFTPPADNPGGPNKTPYDPATGYSDYFLAYARDFNGDSWADILVFGFPGDPALVYVNPQNRPGPWAKHAIFDVADGESPDLKDVNGDGKPELLVHSSPADKPKNAQSGGQLGFAEIDWSQPLGKARFRPITPRSPENDKKYFRYTHGYGAGDVNRDGRVDILTKDGWFEQPADISADTIWPFHPGPFGPAGGGRGGSQMEAYDVNGDGRNDVITSYDGHGFGLGWFEQRADGGFTEHRIMGATPEENAQGMKFSQLHALRLADINGDGLADIVTGKRRWAHGSKGDVEPNEPPVLCWFELRRDGRGGAEYVAHQIDDDSGVGTQVTVGDLNQDGKPDVIVANKRGVFTFTQE